MLEPGGTLLLLGAGKMGGALLQGWLALGLDPRLVAAIDPSPPPDTAALLQHHGIALNPNLADLRPPAVVLLAIKPQTMATALPAVAPVLGQQSLVVSIMAGKTLANIAAFLPPRTAIVRAMPNTPVSVSRGATVAIANDYVKAEQISLAKALLESAGIFAWVQDEALIDAVTAVSGSGPAYVFYLVEALAQAGVAAGLPEDLAMQLARATVSGAGELMHQSAESAEQLRRNVTSPGGTTAAALDVLMSDAGLGPLMRAAVLAAKRRAAELSG